MERNSEMKDETGNKLVDIAYSAKVTLGDLGQDIVWAFENDDVMTLILMLDDAMCDYHFTKKLIKKLKKKLKDEL